MNTRELTKGQGTVLGAAAVVMTAVGGFGAWGTYSNVLAAFHRQATAAGVVAAGEGLTLILALTMLGLTMLGQAAPTVIRVGLWLAPLTACGTGLSVATTRTDAVVYAVTPLAMSGAAEGLGLIARRIVVYRTGRDVEAERRNADVVQQLAYQQAVANGHPDDDRREDATRKAWELVGQVGVGDHQLADGLVEVSRTRLRQGADTALSGMLAIPGAAEPAPEGRPAASATEALRRKFATMDPVDVIRLAADARPDAPPVELATVLAAYGVTVDPVAVAIVLGARPPEYEVHRVDAPANQQVNGLPAVNLQGAVEEAASVLGPDAKTKAIAEHLARHRRLLVDEPYIRAALSRAAKKTTPPPDDPSIGAGGQGYN